MGLAAAFLLCKGMRPAAGVQLAPDRGEHPLRHVQIAADLAFVDLERQVAYLDLFVSGYFDPRQAAEFAISALEGSYYRLQPHVRQ